MSNLIIVKIDVTKVDKNRLFVGKNGAKYLDLVLMPNKTPSAYGDTHYVMQSASKLARDAGVKRQIIGSALEKIPVVDSPDSTAATQPDATSTQDAGAPAVDEDCPF